MQEAFLISKSNGIFVKYNRRRERKSPVFLEKRYDKKNKCFQSVRLPFLSLRSARRGNKIFEMILGKLVHDVRMRRWKMRSF